MAVNVETFCGSCFFCRHGWVNNCTDPSGGWALGCRIDGGQAGVCPGPLCRPGADQDPSRRNGPAGPVRGGHPGHRILGPLRSPRSHRRTRCSSWAPAPPACALSSASCWKTPGGSSSVSGTPSAWLSSGAHYPQVLALEPEGLREAVLAHSAHRGADVVLEVAGSEDTFRLAWECAGPMRW